MTSERVVAVVQARLGSTRLPRKVLAPLAGAPLLVRVLERVALIDGIDAICVAAPHSADGDELDDLVRGLDGVSLHRGSEYDVLSRTVEAARSLGATAVMRITSDCPMIDPAISAAVLDLWSATTDPYARTSFRRGYPHGFDTEVVSLEALEAAHDEATDPYEREHVTPFLWRRPERFPIAVVDHEPDLRHWRLVVDTADDLALAEAVYQSLWRPNGPAFDLADLCRLFAEQPGLLELNSHVPPNEYVGAERRD